MAEGLSVEGATTAAVWKEGWWFCDLLHVMAGGYIKLNVIIRGK